MEESHMKNRAKITALCNQKGGVGKTVTAVNLGIGLAREGKRVLLADIDPQGSLTASLGYQRPDQMENTMAEILGRVISDEPQAPDEGIIHHAEGVDLLPANIELSGLEVTLVNTMSRETILRDYLNSVRDRYDVILLDCCPSLGMLTINALAAADEVIIPAQAHYLSLRGMEQLIRTISNVKRKINPALEIAGILITMADMRTNYSREIIELLRNTYGSKLRIFDSIIPLSIRAAETSAEGRSIYLHDPAGKVSAAYTALTQEVLS
jgi:chromosome partitioning protein